MKASPWHTRPLVYILLFQYAILSYVSLAWGPQWAALLFPEYGYFQLTGTLALFLAAFVILLTFLKALFNFRSAQMHLIKLFALLGLAAWFVLLGAGRIAGSVQSLPEGEAASLTGPTFLQDFSAIFTLFWAFYTLFLPFLAWLWPGFGDLLRRLIPLPGPAIGASFAINLGLAIMSGTLFQRFYDFPAMPFEQAVAQAYEALAAGLCVLLSLDLLWQVNEGIGRARARELFGYRRRRVVVRPRVRTPESVQEPDFPTQPSASIPRRAEAAGSLREQAETQPTRAQGD